MQVLAAARRATVALLVFVLAPAASAAGQETVYLGSDGFPNGSLVVGPRGGEIPNFDPGRDIHPGLFLEPSALGLAEDDETRYQHWQVDWSGRHLTGYPSVVIWGAPAAFDPGKRAVFTVYLLDCDSRGASCSELGASEATIEKGRGASWVESVLEFDAVDHGFGEGRNLGVRVVVSESSESGLILGYGYPKQRSRLTIDAEAPLPPAADAAVFLASGPVESEIITEKAHRLDLVLSVQPVVTDTIGASWLWLAPLGLSTVALVVLGAFLLARLTKPGRHELRFVARVSGQAEPGRVSHGQLTTR